MLTASNKIWWVFWAAVTSLTFFEPSAQCSTVRALSLKGLVEHAHIIVVGAAHRIVNEVDDRGHLVESVTFVIEEYVVGEGPKKITIRLAGGRLAGRGRLVPGEAKLQLAARSILFLERAPQTAGDVFYVVGMAQGLFEVIRDRVTKQDFVTRTLSGLNLVGDAGDDPEGLARGETSTFIPMSEFKNAIRELAK